jgi:hypothetical protein
MPWLHFNMKKEKQTLTKVFKLIFGFSIEFMFDSNFFIVILHIL